MDINNLEFNNMGMYYHGKMNFMVGVCEQLKLPEVFNINLEKSLGRATDIPYGIMAEIVIVNICNKYKLLYILNEYYKEKDLEGIFHCPIKLSQINDDRFGKFLDEFYEAGPRKIFGKLSSQKNLLFLNMSMPIFVSLNLTFIYKYNFKVNISLICIVIIMKHMHYFLIKHT